MTAQAKEQQAQGEASVYPREVKRLLSVRATMPADQPFQSRVLLIDYPASSSYTRSAIKLAATKILPDWHIVTSLPSEQICSLQFSDYDSLRFEAMQEPTRCMLNAYVIRKVSL